MYRCIHVYSVGPTHKDLKAKKMKMVIEVMEQEISGKFMNLVINRRILLVLPLNLAKCVPLLPTLKKKVSV